MKICFSLVWFIMLSAAFSLKDHVERHYFCSDGSSITISGDSLLFYPSDVVNNRVIPPSICSIKKIQGPFYVISSVIDPFPNIIHDYSITTSTFGSNGRDSAEEDKCLQITFHMPYDSSLRISVETLSGDESYSFIYNKKNNSISVPKDSLGGRLHIRLSPERIHAQDQNGKYYGIVEAILDSLFLGNPQEVHITIPELDSSYFEQHLIVDEIISIKKNYVLWRGKTFILTK